MSIFDRKKSVRSKKPISLKEIDDFLLIAEGAKKTTRAMTLKSQMFSKLNYKALTMRRLKPKSIREPFIATSIKKFPKAQISPRIFDSLFTKMGHFSKEDKSNTHQLSGSQIINFKDQEFFVEKDCDDIEDKDYCYRVIPDLLPGKEISVISFSQLIGKKDSKLLLIAQAILEKALLTFMSCAFIVKKSSFKKSIENCFKYLERQICEKMYIEFNNTGIILTLIMFTKEKVLLKFIQDLCSKYRTYSSSLCKEEHLY